MSTDAPTKFGDEGSSKLNEGIDGIAESSNDGSDQDNSSRQTEGSIHGSEWSARKFMQKGEFNRMDLCRRQIQSDQEIDSGKKSYRCSNTATLFAKVAEILARYIFNSKTREITDERKAVDGHIKDLVIFNTLNEALRRSAM
ncbi:hypothetical protein ACOME3_008949 [Neoechinorhynchus agilis]